MIKKIEEILTVRESREEECNNISGKSSICLIESEEISKRK